MQGVFFEIDKLASVFALLFIAAIFILKRWSSSFESPKLYFSYLPTMNPEQKAGRAAFARLPFWTVNCALVSFLIAFIDPHFLIEKPFQEVNEGIAIYLIADRSGSMIEKINTFITHDTVETIRKIDLLKQLTTDFIEERPNDLIGLVAFARTAQVLSPLTLDHKAVLKDLTNLQVVTDQNQDGTATGYAIYKTANLITETRHFAEEEMGGDKPSYTIKSAIMILVTDGFYAPSPLDEGNSLRTMDPIVAAEYAKEQDIRLYLVLIEPALASEKFAANRHIMEKAADLTGGKMYMVDQATGLKQIYDDINRLEKSNLPNFGISKEKQPQHYRRFSLFPYFIACGMAFLLAAVILDSFFFKAVP